MSGAYAPLRVNTADDHGAIPVVTGYFLLGASAVVTAARIWVSYRAKHAFRLDDAFFYVSVVIAMLQSVLVDQASRHGLGRHMDSLSESEISGFYKFVYSSAIVGIASMFFSKLSILMLYERISQDQHPLGIKIFKGIIALWTIFSIFAQSFNCGVPRPWVTDPATCSTKGRLNYPIIILNAVSDGAMAVWLVYVVRELGQRMKNRVLVAALFSARILVCISAILQIVFTARSIDKPDQSWVMDIPVVLLSITTHISVITATIPRVHSFIADLRTNTLRNTSYDKEANNMSRSDQANGNGHAVDPAIPDNNSGNANGSQSSRRSRFTWPKKNKRKTGLTTGSTTNGSYYQPPVYVSRVVTYARPERGGARDSLEAIVPDAPAQASGSNPPPAANNAGPSSNPPPPANAAPPNT